jgi:hypothetical protein
MGYKNQLMPYREITAVCSEVHTKHINTLWGQNVELANVKLEVHEITTGLGRVNINCLLCMRNCEVLLLAGKTNGMFACSVRKLERK